MSMNTKKALEAFKRVLREVIDQSLSAHNAVPPLVGVEFENLVTGGFEMALAQIPVELTALSNGMEVIEKEILPQMLKEVNTDMRRIHAVAWVSEAWAVPVGEDGSRRDPEESVDKVPVLLVTIETGESCRMTSWLVETDPAGNRSLGEVRHPEEPVQTRFSPLFKEVFNKDK
jgi:hypothetical protein